MGSVCSVQISFFSVNLKKSHLLGPSTASLVASCVNNCELTETDTFSYRSYLFFSEGHSTLCSNISTDSQHSSSNLTRATLQDYCRSDNSSHIRLNTLNNSGLLTELLIRPMWTFVDGNYTPWIAYIGNRRQCLNTIS